MKMHYEAKFTKTPKDNSALITNNHQYLNFIRKNQKFIEEEKLKLNNNVLSSKEIIQRNNSVFAIKDNHRYFKTQKLMNSVDIPNKNQNKIKKTHANSTKHEEVSSLASDRIVELIEKKNKQIQQSLIKEKQSMSEIIYNYDLYKFKSMESNYYRMEKKNKEKQGKDLKNIANPQIKFPHLSAKNPENINKPHINEIFTIDYDEEGRKLVKVKLQNRSENNKDKNSLNESKLQKSQSKNEMISYDLGYKKKKNLNEFGIEIKSMTKNHQLFNSYFDFENGFKIRKEIYELMPNGGKEDKMKDLKKQTDLELNKKCEEEQFRKCLNNLLKKKDSKLSEIVNSQTSLISTNSVFVKVNNKETIPPSSLKNYQHIPQDSEETCRQKQKNQKDKNKEKDRKNIHLIQHSTDKQLTIYDLKMKSYREFLFMMNLAHRKFDPLILKEIGSFKNQDKYKFYIGRGNNSLLIKSLMKRRFWWTQQDDYKKSHFVWAQLKINQFYQFQSKTSFDSLQCKIQQKDLESPKKKKQLQKSSTQNKILIKNIAYKAPLPLDKDKIFTLIDKKLYENYESSLTTQESYQKMSKFQNRLKYFPSSVLQVLEESKSNLSYVHNHFQCSYHLGNKKALFYNLKQYYSLLNKNVFQILPLTFHIKNGIADPQYTNFMKQFKKIQNFNRNYKKNTTKRESEDEEMTPKSKNLWIVKPGEQSNRGQGITVIEQAYELNMILKKKEKHGDGSIKTYIVQKYIQKPMLYKGRKFDIRHYMLISRLHGMMRVYWFGEGYIRTSSYDYDISDVGNEMIHLTNDAIQKHSTFYGKHEEGNKLSYSDFQKYLDSKYEGKYNFAASIYPKMKEIASNSVKSTYLELDPNRCEHNFEVFGLDFMIDRNFDVWLIQINTNPCLELSSKLLSRIIPTMLEHSFRLTIDVLYPPPTHYPNSQKYLAPDDPLGRLQYELIFDQARDSKEIKQLYTNVKKVDLGDLNQDDQVYDNDGNQIDLNAELD